MGQVSMIKVITNDGGIYKFTRVKDVMLRTRVSDVLIINAYPIQIENIKSVHMGDTEKFKWPHVYDYFNKDTQ
jgi:hypothetical protein